MKSLKELIETYGGFLNDEEIIVKYFVENELEDRGIELLTRLSRAKIKKLSWQLGYARNWCGMFALNTENLRISFGVHAEKMLALQQWYMLNIEPFSDNKICDGALERSAGIREILMLVQDIDLPKNAFFFRPCLEWLHKNGIYFRNEKG